MHCKTNTYGGQYGFVVELADGTIVCEDELTWDDIQGVVKTLSIAHLPTYHQNKHTFVTLKNFEKYFFSNVAVSIRNYQTDLRGGKVFGGCNGNKAKLIHMSFDNGMPKVEVQVEHTVADLGYEPHTFRKGQVA